MYHGVSIRVIIKKKIKMENTQEKEKPDNVKDGIMII